MALSGTNYTNVNSHWRLQQEWSATQNVANNTSTITVKLYWMALDSYGAVYSSASKDGGQTIHTTSDTFSGSGLAALSGNQKKLINTHVVSVSHNANGTASVSLSAFFDAEVTLSGTYYGRISVNGTATLNTIPRASTLTSSISWTAGTQNLALSIDRASSSFTHTALLYIQEPQGAWNYIGEVAGIGTSTTFTFNSTHITRMYQALEVYENRPAKVELRTYSGGTHIGTTTKTGTVYGYLPGYVGFSNFNIGSNVPATIHRYNSTFDYDVRFVFGSFSKTFTGQGASPTFTWTAADKSSMYAQVPNSNSGVGTAYVSTYYNGVLINEAVGSGFTAYVTNSDPTLPSTFTYKDDNPTTTAITVNNQYIIQNKSTVLVEIPVASRAVAVNSSTMSKYEAKLAGKTISATYSSTAVVSFDFGLIDATTNQTLTLKAIDSRGNSTSLTKTVLMVPYSLPVVNSSANRLNNFEDSTTLTLNGSVSPLNVAGSNKNTVSVRQYQYKVSTSGTYGALTNFGTSTSTFPAYNAPNIALTLDNLQAFNIKVIVTDRLGTTVKDLFVPVGQPIMFMDSVKKSVSINMFPTTANSFEINQNLILHPSTTPTAKVGDIFSGSTLKSYINFKAASGSNDPGYIMHESSGVTADANSAVLHLCPSDDADSVKDYVSIHGTNDPENIKLYTSGNAWFGGHVNISGTLGVAGDLVTDGQLHAGGVDFRFGFNDTTRGNTGSSRAMVKDSGGRLTLNYANDFFGGISVGSKGINVIAHSFLSLINGWTVYSSGFNSPSYTKSADNMVQLKGLAKGGVAGSTIGVLPVGCRPYNGSIFSVATSAGYGVVYVYAGGTVVFSSGGTGWVALDTITFFAEN